MEKAPTNVELVEVLLTFMVLRAQRIRSDQEVDLTLRTYWQGQIDALAQVQAFLETLER